LALEQKLQAALDTDTYEALVAAVHEAKVAGFPDNELAQLVCVHKRVLSGERRAHGSFVRASAFRCESTVPMLLFLCTCVCVCVVRSRACVDGASGGGAVDAGSRQTITRHH
jgi:hypothetical protein